MIRTGIIRSYNRVARVGTIEDGNRQRIKFHAKLSSFTFKPGDIVHFEIYQSTIGLHAINVLNVIERNGEKVNLR